MIMGFFLVLNYHKKSLAKMVPISQWPSCSISGFGTQNLRGMEKLGWTRDPILQTEQPEISHATQKYACDRLLRQILIQTIFMILAEANPTSKRLTVSTTCTVSAPPLWANLESRIPCSSSWVCAEKTVG